MRKSESGVNKGFSRTWCPECGKRCYVTRKAAKAAARKYFPGLHIEEYRCGQWFHHSSYPERRKRHPSPRMEERNRKMRERESFVEEALEQMYKKAEKEDAIPWNDAECDTAELEETFPEEPR